MKRKTKKPKTVKMWAVYDQGTFMKTWGVLEKRADFFGKDYPGVFLDSEHYKRCRKNGYRLSQVEVRPL